MPSYTRGKEREVSQKVQIYNGGALYYQWMMKNLSSIPGFTGRDLAAELGHGVTPPTGSIIVVRAKSPRPARMKFTIAKKRAKDQQGSVTTFCAEANIAAGLAAGWNLVKGILAPSTKETVASVTVFAKLSNNCLYAFPMDISDANSYAPDLGLLRVADITTDAERKLIVRGSSIPYPGYASKVLSTGEITKPFSTNTNVAATGWFVMSREIVA